MDIKRNNKGQFIKGESSFRGKHHTEETKEKIRKSRRGIVYLESTRIKMRKRMSGNANPFYGKSHSPETIGKIIQAHKGKPSPLLGRHLSEFTKRKLREANLGKKASSLTKMKMREANKKHWLNNDIEKKKVGDKHRGERNFNWKGGITPLIRQIRLCFKYRQWRSDIFTRDDFTCVLCGKRGGNLEIDHFPKTFSDIFHSNKVVNLTEALNCEEFWNLNNGRTLCENCHKETKKKKPRK